VNDTDLGGTCLQYAQLDRLDHIMLFRYIQFYLRHPTVEHLIKEGFAEMIKRWFAFYPATIPDWIDWKQHDVRKMLGMNALELREIRNRKIDIRDYRRMRDNLPYLTMEECFDFLPVIRNYWGYLSHYDEQRQRKILKYLRKQNARYSRVSRLMTIGDYHDYLHECRELGYDLHDRVILYPRCLADAHSRTSDAISAIRCELLRREAARRAAEEQQKLEESNKARRKLAFEKDGLRICVPAAPEEIVREGAALHHCVGGYAARHASGTLHILFIRKTDAPDVPYYTMELSADGRVVQVRGLRNCDPPEDVIALVEAYKQYIRPLFDKQKRQKVRITA
jgi:hypothetical protein